MNDVIYRIPSDLVVGGLVEPSVARPDVEMITRIVVYHSPGQHRGLGHRVGGHVTVEVGDLEQRRAAHSPGGVGGSDAGDLQAHR